MRAGSFFRDNCCILGSLSYTLEKKIDLLIPRMPWHGGRRKWGGCTSAQMRSGAGVFAGEIVGFDLV